MHKLETKKLLNQIHIAENRDYLIQEVLSVIDVDVKQRHITTLGFINQHGFNLMAKDSALVKPFTDLDYILRDGIGMKLAFKLFNMPAGTNLNGTDLIPQLVKNIQASNIKSDIDFFIFGTEEPWLDKGSNNLLGEKARHTLNGFKDLQEYVGYLTNNIEPDRFNVIILAMGMPKQEELAQLIKENIKRPGLVICGGAIIDFQANRFKRAPRVIRKLSLEWLYRLFKEPNRLFKRYVFGIPIFFINLITFR